MVAALRELIPMEAADKDAVVTRFAETLTAVVLGSVLTAAAQGILGGLAYWALGVPFSVLLAGATAFLSLLPYGGPLVWLGVAAYLAVTGDYVRASIMAGWGALVISSADNLIRPLVIGGRTKIPTVFLFFGILGGLQAYGFLGMFLGPAVIAILVAFARIYREQYAGERPRTPPAPA
jgi:predicted PurR-regulated permease PerM